MAETVDYAPFETTTAGPVEPAAPAPASLAMSVTLCGQRIIPQRHARGTPRLREVWAARAARVTATARRGTGGRPCGWSGRGRDARTGRTG